MLQRLLKRVVVGVALLVALGCASTQISPNAVYTLNIDSTQTVWLEGDTYTIAETPRALQRRGVPKRQTLAVHFNESIGRDTMLKFDSALRRAGYVRIIFVGDQHAHSQVVEPSATGGAPKPPVKPIAPPRRRR